MEHALKSINTPTTTPKSIKMKLNPRNSLKVLNRGNFKANHQKHRRNLSHFSRTHSKGENVRKIKCMRAQGKIGDLQRLEIESDGPKTCGNYHIR